MPLEMVAEGDGIRCWGGVDEVQVVVWLSNWEVVLPHFYSMGIKIDKITRIFDKVEYIKNRGVTYWAEKNGPIVIRIISS